MIQCRLQTQQPALVSRKCIILFHDNPNLQVANVTVWKLREVVVVAVTDPLLSMPFTLKIQKVAETSKLHSNVSINTANNSLHPALSICYGNIPVRVVLVLWIGCFDRVLVIQIVSKERFLIFMQPVYLKVLEVGVLLPLYRLTSFSNWRNPLLESHHHVQALSSNKFEDNSMKAMIISYLCLNRIIFESGTNEG